MLHFQYSLYFVDVAVCLVSPEVDSNNVCIQKYLMKKVVRAENIDVGNTRRVKSIVKESL